MAAVCCDTSFLFSLYARDAFTSNALALVGRMGQPLTLSLLNEFEFLNAVRFSAFRGLMTTAQANLVLTDFEADAASGKLVREVCNLADAVKEAKRLSALHTIMGGHRAFDILHVATALQLNASEFLTFDRNQKKLAQAEGLRTPR